MCRAYIATENDAEFAVLVDSIQTEFTEAT